MSTQPEALRLAELFEIEADLESLYRKAAAELRRLHAQRNQLLEALRSIADCCDEEHAARDYASRQAEIRGIARAAIAKAEGQ
jgi:hypothetical protein